MQGRTRALYTVGGGTPSATKPPHTEGRWWMNAKDSRVEALPFRASLGSAKHRYEAHHSLEELLEAFGRVDGRASCLAPFQKRLCARCWRLAGRWALALWFYARRHWRSSPPRVVRRRQSGQMNQELVELDL